MSIIQNNNPFSQLPPEMLTRIFFELPPKELANAQIVSRLWNETGVYVWKNGFNAFNASINNKEEISIPAFSQRIVSEFTGDERLMNRLMRMANSKGEGVFFAPTPETSHFPNRATVEEEQNDRVVTINFNQTVLRNGYMQGRFKIEAKEIEDGELVLRRLSSRRFAIACIALLASFILLGVVTFSAVMPKKIY